MNCCGMDLKQRTEPAETALENSGMKINNHSQIPLKRTVHSKMICSRSCQSKAVCGQTLRRTFHTMTSHSDHVYQAPKGQRSTIKVVQ